MSKSKNGKKRLSVYYAVLACLFLALFIYVGCKEQTEIYQARTDCTQREINNYDYMEKHNPDAPLKITKEYRWTLEEMEPGDVCLAFYTVHQYVDVTLDGELIYQLKSSDKNRIGKTVGSNWVVIPLYLQDEGKEIIVSITPVYESVKNRTPVFQVGSRFTIYMQQLKKDFFQIFLCILMIIVGIVFILIAIMGYHRKGESPDLVYLALTIILIGTNRITDIRLIPWLVPKNSLVFNYITLGVLSLACVPFLIFMQRQFFGNIQKHLERTSILGIVFGYIVLILQLLGLADLRESLFLSHIAIAISVCTVIVVIFTRWKEKKRDVKIWITMACFLLCTSGILLDLFEFYMKGNSVGLLNTVAIFLIYALIMGIYSTVEIQRQYFIDHRTGLYNQSRCTEVLADPRTQKNSTGLIMFDLNYLKHVNDTMGHEIGDELIKEFASALKQVYQKRNHFVGRYGGDEFIIILKNTSQKQIELLFKELSLTVERINQCNVIPDISYSAGYALSDGTEKMKDLFEKADEFMYQEKKRYHDSTRGERDCNISI